MVLFCRLLITLKSDGQTKTLTFDGKTQSVVWLGMNGPAGPDSSVARIEASEGHTRLVPASGIRISKPRKRETLPIDANGKLCIEVEDVRTGKTTWLYIRSIDGGARGFTKLGFIRECVLTIGRAPDCEIVYDNPLTSAHHAELRYQGRRLQVVDLESANGTVVNGRELSQHQPHWLEAGDVVEILDLTIAVGRDFICVNHPHGLSLGGEGCLGLMLHAAVVDSMPEVECATDEPDVFYPAPRLSKTVHPLKLNVDGPPAKKQEDKQPVIMQLGPSFLMGLSSVFMVASSVSNIAEGGNWLSVSPSIAMAVAMIGGSVVWPIVARSYTRRRDEREEAKRRRLYVAYLDDIENKLTNEVSIQSEILKENRRPVNELMKRAAERSPLLMNHTAVHEDFLDLRVGVGDEELAAEVAWPQRHFSLDEDRMLDMVDELSRKSPKLCDIPVAFNPSNHRVAGILGERARVWEFLRGLLVQVCAMYSYQDVKIIMLSNHEEAEEWEFLTHLGHLYDPTGQNRYVGLSYSGMIEEDLLLEHELERRSESKVEVVGDLGVYYLVICANPKLAKRSEAISRLLKIRTNLGISLIYLGSDISDLPRECGYIVDLDPNPQANLGISLDDRIDGQEGRTRSARMFARADVQGTLRQFDPDIMVSRERAHAFALDLARVRLDVPEQRTAVPDSVGFLEMLEVGNVNHINVGHRWTENDASQSLQATIGVGEEGERTVLDLHEDIHGPHGLIAGTTGSGKSEFIITYILSMCVNYAPDEVAFVLIDYKGGGLAGAFENERHHLPHLAGVITNLDGGAIQRSLVSIQSELKRRQDIFNMARDVTGEATIDIYKYLTYYRQGILKEPLPHLFIVADEFAELKQQESEFMDELVSAARIGRSLGVHLILATQKPTGVVDDQIQSNARFKVCLKVSDSGDSREMIRRDDAAEITQPGRYYLLVGYNESFSMGQAAYAGGPYIATDAYEQRRDDTVELLDAEGSTIARLKPTKAHQEQGESELNTVLAQIEDAAALAGKHAKRLWLDPLPPCITFDSLLERYGAPERKGLHFLAGEVDDPEHQRQFALTIDLAKDGNVMLYGSQNSDVDGLLLAMLYSLASSYTSDELWLYGIDYGSGSLSRLSGLAHMGGVALTGDKERLGNLLRMIEAEVHRRRTLLSPYGGSLDEYNKANAEKLPRIVVGLVNLASFQEINEDCEDVLVSLTRDAPRYGIHFVVTAASVSTPRMRLQANFGLALPTMLNDTGDYAMVLGSMLGKTAPRGERRGLMLHNKRILEFQGLYIGEDALQEDGLIEKLVQKSNNGRRANAIPMLPAYVHMQDMGGKASLGAVPIGFSRLDILPVWHSLERNPHLLVFGNDDEALARYLRGLADAFSHQEDFDYRIVDTHGVLGELTDENILQSEDEVVPFITALYEGTEAPSVVVFPSIVQTVNGLPYDTSQKLQTYLAEERATGKTALVVASELWRTSSLYQDWYKAVTSRCNGVWVGGGFSDQSIFRFAMSKPEYRVPARRSEGFYVMKGTITAVKLLESEDEPHDTDDVF